MADKKQADDLQSKIDECVSFIMAKLDEMGLIIHDAPSDKESVKIHAKIEDNVNLLQKFHFILEDKQKFSEYKKAVTGYFDENDFMRMFSNLHIENILEQQEEVKRWLLLILNSEKEVDGIKISKSDMFGKLLNKLSKILKFDEIFLLFNNELRNALAHGDWWWEDGTFCYRKRNGETDKMSFEEFLGVVNINMLTKSFADYYLKNFIKS